MSKRLLIPALLTAIAGALFFAVMLGSTSLAVADLFKSLIGQGSASHEIIVWQIRMPRALAALVVGIALGISGAALQGLLRNPLAEPGVLGVSASASLGATLALFFGALNQSPLFLPLAAVGGALAATALLAGAAVRVRSVVTLILIGVGLSSFAGAVMALLMNLSANPFTLADLVNWMLGSVANRSFNDLLFAAPFLLTGMALLIYVRSDLEALTLGEEAAHGIGLNLNHTRLMIVLGAGLCTGAAVSLAGAIGFVGIVAPHLVRPWVGYQPSRVLIPAGLCGGLMLLVADIVIRILPSDSELKLGVVAALIGAPVFVWIASRRRISYD